jgi:VanZ family protein
LKSGGTRNDASGLFVRHWLPVLAYVSIIFVLSAQPNLQPPLTFQNSDKLVHVLEYGGLGLLFAWALRATTPARSWTFVSLVALGTGLCIGAGDEYFQSFIRGRESSVFDWLADGSGLTLAQLAYLAFARDPKG